MDIVQDDHAVVRGGQVGGDGGGRRGLLAGAGLERDGGRLAVSQRLEAGDVLGELLVDGGLRARDRAHLQPDGLGPGRSGRRGRSILPIFCISISGMAFSTFAFF